ncbi:MAG TPA: TetR/AcrR family transcriptional regulator C-terminal domain-containing protein [Microbacterium sp.]|uniref:TetR/AcrR family transcriptional regulator n=1 Tax=Microbacterium sp. TaxID=51671 RepID=UPI002C00E875|nr:TetR/AcrR family transcriptional regulator C-terminal domain-containing protein [Microbacterium sp.]HWI30050.1 TetR/AcrR family transcriptional regulator C-terminal domain-containing protein [Microbacterium sp.]
MPRTSPRLSRTVILDRALEIAEKTDDQPGQALTGRSLGDALGVDRSAIWRHFEDKDDLLLAVADRIIGVILESLPPSASPQKRLEEMFRAFIRTFGRYPFVASELGPRNFTLVNGSTAWERIVAALLEMGVPSEDVVLHYRVFADVMIALSASKAVEQQRSAEERAREFAMARAALYQLEPEDFPHTMSAIDLHLSMTDEKVAEGFLAIYWAGVRSLASARTP